MSSASEVTTVWRYRNETIRPIIVWGSRQNGFCPKMMPTDNLYLFVMAKFSKYLPNYFF